MHCVVLWINDKKMATSNHGDVATVHSRGKSICFCHKYATKYVGCL